MKGFHKVLSVLVVLLALLQLAPMHALAVAAEQPGAAISWCHAAGDKLAEAQDWEAAAGSFVNCSRTTDAAGAATAWALYRTFEMYSYKLGMPDAALEACSQGWEAAPAAELAWCAAYQAYWLQQHALAAQWADRAIAVGCFEGSCHSLEHLVHGSNRSNLQAAWEGPYDVLHYARLAEGNTAGAQQAYRRRHQAGNARKAYNKDAASFHATKAAALIPMTPIVKQPEACGTQMLSDLQAGSRYRPRFHVVAFATDLEAPNLVPMLTSAEAFGIQVTVLTTSHSFSVAKGMWGVRMMLSTEFLNMLPEQDYVIFVDTQLPRHGVVFAANASAILAAFKEASQGRDLVVFSAQDTCFPDAYLCGKFPEAPSRDRYLNGGGAMGSVRAWRCALAAVGAALDDHRFAYSDDQGIFNHLFVSTVNTSKPLIMLDTGHRLIASARRAASPFNNNSASSASNWVWVKGIGWTNKITGGTPKVFQTPAKPSPSEPFAVVIRQVEASNSTASSNIRVFVGVLSASGHVRERLAIRETWGADSRLARVVFFVLRPASNDTFLQLQREAASYSDIIVVSEVKEDYYKVTQTTLALFRAAAAMGPAAITHVLKTDDDCYVRVPLLLAALARMPRQALFSGWPMKLTHIPVEWPNWKWSVPRDNMPSSWPIDVPVRYGWGRGYVLSIDLATYIGAGVPHLLMEPDNLLIIEDIAVGMWVQVIAERHNISVRYDGSLPVNAWDDCESHHAITHIARNAPEPLWEMMRCMHAHGGECCD